MLQQQCERLDALHAGAAQRLRPLPPEEPFTADRILHGPRALRPVLHHQLAQHAHPRTTHSPHRPHEMKTAFAFPPFHPKPLGTFRRSPQHRLVRLPQLLHQLRLSPVPFDQIQQVIVVPGDQLRVVPV